MFGNRKRIKDLEVKVEVLEKLTATLTQELEKRKPKRDSRGRFISKKK